MVDRSAREKDPTTPSLHGRTALVTGSTSGIGLGIAKALASAGVNVALNGFGDLEAIEKLRRQFEGETGVRTIYSPADMSKPEQIAGMIAEIEHSLGRIDILVNNAGIQHVEPIESFPVDKWDLILAINLTAAFHTTRAVIGGMKDRGYGRIINIASAHALVASPFKSAYVAAKHGLLGLTKTVALEAAANGVSCNAICPGYVLTPLVEKQIPDTAKARGISEAKVVSDVILAAQPTGKFVTVEQIAALSLFLCSDGAGSITGAALPIDGGWTSQ